MQDQLKDRLEDRTHDGTQNRSEERRRFPRTRCFKGAKVVAPGQAVVACVVRNVSAEGARLQFGSFYALPEEFDLCFDSGRRVRQCRVVWRTEGDAGVWFAQQ